MELQTTQTVAATAAHTFKRGQEAVTVAAGKHVKIETSPDGVELLDAVVPTGKTWTVTVAVSIVETDA